MTLFSLIDEEAIHLSSQKKIIPAEEFSELLSASQIIEKTKEAEKAYRSAVAQECETLKERAEAEGFDEGLKKWNEQLIFLENEISRMREEMENAIVPLALAAVKKIIGKELATDPETIAHIVATALKTVSQHRRISIFVNQVDLEQVEASRPRLKSLFEHLESLHIAPREDVLPGGCVIETESGIINAKLENQLQVLETAFTNFFQKQKGT